MKSRNSTILEYQTQDKKITIGLAFYIFQNALFSKVQVIHHCLRGELAVQLGLWSLGSLLWWIWTKLFEKKNCPRLNGTEINSVSIY